MLLFNEITLKKDKIYTHTDCNDGTVSNDRYLLICAKSGFLTIKTNKLSFLKKGRCAIINKGADFSIKNVGDDNCSFLALFLNADIVDGFIKNYPDFTTLLNRYSSMIFAPNNSLLDLLLSQLKIGGATLDALSLSLIGECINDVYGFTNLTKNECAVLLKNRIDNHSVLTDKIYDEYKKYPISHTLLIAEFKALTGLTPIEYSLDKKVELSKLLLKETSLLVNEISEVAGHKSISHFIKKFKEKTGVTPLSYKNSKV